MQEQVVATAAKLANCCLGEVEATVEQDLLVLGVVERESEVDALEADVVVGARRQRSVGVPVDRGAEDQGSRRDGRLWAAGGSRCPP